MDRAQRAVPGTTPVPSADDDLETTAQKLESLANVVREGNSLALYTGLKLSSPQPRNAEAVAISQMSPIEKESYTDWKSKTTPVPPFDWEQNSAPIPEGAQSAKKMTRRAEIMDMIWERQCTTPEHASWLTYNMSGMLPLIKAISKVLTAQLQYQQQYQNDPLIQLGPMEAAEVETARSIIRVAQVNRQRELERIGKANKSITRAIEVLNSRVVDLERSESSGQKRSQVETTVPVPDGSPPGGVRLGQ